MRENGEGDQRRDVIKDVHGWKEGYETERKYGD
jgi:hypothetical protein